MGKHNEAGNNPAKTDPRDDYRGPLGDLYWVVGSASIAFVCLLLAALFWPNLTERTKFFTTNLFNLIIAFAVIAQVIIYRKQWAVMERQFAYAERAYVGVDSIIPCGENRDTVLTIENLGRLPADHIRVDVDFIMLVPPSTLAKYPNSLVPYYCFDWWFDFQRTKLFRGKTNLRILIPIHEKLNSIQEAQISAGNARLIAQIRITYADGLGNIDQSDYAFRLEGGKWLPWWAWTDDEMEKRIAEEQARYHPK